MAPLSTNGNPWEAWAQGGTAENAPGSWLTSDMPPPLPDHTAHGASGRCLSSSARLRASSLRLSAAGVCPGPEGPEQARYGTVRGAAPPTDE